MVFYQLLTCLSKYAPTVWTASIVPLENIRCLHSLRFSKKMVRSVVVLIHNGGRGKGNPRRPGPLPYSPYGRNLTPPRYRLRQIYLGRISMYPECNVRRPGTCLELTASVLVHIPALSFCSGVRHHIVEL